MSNAQHTPRLWADFSSEKPEVEGVFEWRVPSVAVPGIVVLLAAHMRERNAGYRKEVSPAFDYWDGYRLHVPAGTQWRKPETEIKIPTYEKKLIGVEGLDHAPCIYCGNHPTLHAAQRSRDGGCVIGPNPQHLNSWWLECCQWGKTPHLTDPREIARIRNAAIAAAKGGAA